MSFQIPAGSRIFVQSAIAAAQNITAITQANPAVATYDGDDPSDGDYIRISAIGGMIELEDALVKIANVDTGNKTFELVNEDTTDSQAFTAGQFQVVSVDTDVKLASGMEITGGEQEFFDFQLLAEKRKRRIPTTQTPIEIGIPMLWDPSESSSIAIRKASRNSEQLGVKILFPNSFEMLGYGYIAASGLPATDDANSIINTTAKFAISGPLGYVIP